MTTRRLEIWGVDGIGEVGPGTDLAEEIAAAAPRLRDGDIVVITSKVVSKAEGRVVAMDREAAIDAESVRVVATRGATRIVQTRHGFVLAAAGVDASNVEKGTVALLPADPDASARAIRAGLRDALGIDVAVIVTDTFGRPWRDGLVDVAIGAAGIDVLDDHRGRIDAHGHTLEMTVTAVGDEIAAAAELVKGKLDQVPVAVVRGLDVRRPDRDLGARPLVRAAEDDMFRLGTAEAMRAALFAVETRRGGAGYDPQPPDPLHAAVAAARAAAAPTRDRPWQFVVADLPLPKPVRAAVVHLPADAPREDREAHLIGVGAAVGNLVTALAIAGVDAQWLTVQDVDAAALSSVVPPGCEPVAVVAVRGGAD